MERRYQRIREVFLEASRLQGEARRAHLDRACSGDTDLRLEVERLLEDAAVPTGELFRAPDTLSEPPAAIGRYRIERELGRGGMGVVYAARDPERDAHVALKVVHPWLLASAEPIERFQREGRLGSRVVHENVVRTVDVGTADVSGTPVQYLVMEYVEGQTLRERLRDLGVLPETLLREIALQVTAGLIAIHEAGIVHRDLKPENILVTHDQRVAIMDLGIAKPSEETTDLTMAGQFLGSLAYAAPEQCEGGSVGARADLYGLGVVLCELATGANPLRRDTPGAMIRAHLDEPVPPANVANPEVSAFLAAVLATLLAKRPADRFASARELRRVLVEGETGPWWAARERAAVMVQLPDIPVRRDVGLHGRFEELARLKEAWSAASSGQGGSVLLTGEPGLGKSRLVDALLRELDAAAVHVLYGSFPPTGGLSGLCGAIRGRFGDHDLETALRPYLAASPALIPAFAALVRGESPPTDAVPLQGNALATLCRALLRALAEERPVVWVVEDLHFAPEEARSIARLLAGAATGNRALVVLTSRSDTHAPVPGTTRRIALPRLSPRAVIELLRDVFKSDKLADRLGARIAHKSDGVPFFVLEVVRGLEEGRFIVRGSDGTYVQTRAVEQIEVPSAVRELVGVRLDDLDREERILVDMAAVLGFDFDAELLAPVLERPLVGVLQDLADIERQHGIVRAAGRRYRFDHHQIREVAYDVLPARLRMEYHGMVADAYAQQLGDTPVSNRDAHFLAHHHVRGPRPAAAVPHLARALEHLQRQFLGDEQQDLAERALALEGVLTGTARAETLLQLAHRFRMTGARDRVDARLDEARKLADGAGDDMLRVKARLETVRHMSSVGHPERALRILDEANTIAAASGDRRLQGAVAGTRSLVFIQLGRYAEAETEARRRLEIAVEIGDGPGEAISLSRLNAALLEQGRIDEAEAVLERNLDVCRRSEGFATEASVIGNLGVLSRARGRWEQAMMRYELYVSLSREYAYLNGEAIGCANLADLFTLLGRWDDARAHGETALELAGELGEPRLIGRVRMALGRLARDEGDFQGAHAQFDAALALLEAHGDRSSEAECRCDRAGLLVQEGEAGTAAAELDEAARLATEAQAVSLRLLARARRAALPGGDPVSVAGEAAELGARAEHHVAMAVRFHLWEATRDRAHLDRAHALLLEARDHAPECDRERMLTAVPLHRAIIEASDA
ncbi:MAG: serine/threonine-protein kinase [Planctomycetota bacterium]|jgi:tetratricopeptide (TPR) repeat protein